MRYGCKILVLVGVLGISAMFYSDALGVDADDGGFSYDNYAVVLRNYVDDAGMGITRDCRPRGVNLMNSLRHLGD